VSRPRLADPVRRFAPLALLAFALLLALAAGLNHLARIGEQEEERAAIARYARIAADLPRLEAASRALPAAAAPDNPSLAVALWQSRLAQLAGARGLQLTSAEPLLAEGKPSILLELVGATSGLLAFVYEVERGSPAMTIARLEVASIAAADGAASEPQLRIRLQAQAAP